MSERKKRVAVTEGIFRAVKALLRAGEKQAACADYMGVSVAVVSRISVAEDWEDYKNRVVKQARSGKAYAPADSKAEAAAHEAHQALWGASISGTRVVKPAPEDRAAGMYQSNRIVEELKIQNEHLKSISAKLAFLVEKFSDNDPETKE